jgi:predicted Zn finger-like uncharacterized protein
MDVRCEKCQTEYELDESRLKPGGVTVKCTNCGHMFKIRKRSNTNVGVPAVAGATENRPRPVSGKQPVVPPPRPDSFGDAPLKINDLPSGPNSERQWLVRLENGETKTCRELATLQQWIVAGVVGRESLISRTGKTWKRLGDVSELSQYFTIADEARAQRSAKPTNKAGDPLGATMLGVGKPGGVEDEDEARSTGSFRARPPTPPPQPQHLGAAASASKANPMAQTEVAPSMSARSMPADEAPTTRRPPTQPPPRVKAPSDGGRQTAMWANNEVKASDSMVAMPQGPRGGKLTGGADEPAFAGRVRMEPSSSPFDAGRVGPVDDDDDVYPAARGSRAGMWIALASLLVIGAAAGAIYMLVFRDKGSEQVAQPTVKDAAVTAIADRRSTQPRRCPHSTPRVASCSPACGRAWTARSSRSKAKMIRRHSRCVHG